MDFRNTVKEEKKVYYLEQLFPASLNVTIPPVINITEC